MNGKPDTVEHWAPMFLFFSGTTTAKYTREQILNEQFAITFDHCKLCDSKVEGSHKKHMKTHERELDHWLANRRKESAKKSAAGLEAARREKKLIDHTIDPQEDDE